MGVTEGIVLGMVLADVLYHLRISSIDACFFRCMKLYVLCRS